MSFYRNSPPGRAIMIEQGWPVYLFGSRQSIDAELYITSVAITSNVATYNVTSWSGPVPVVGAFASVSRSQTSSGLFNVTNVPITAVSLNAAGTGTITLALTGSNVATTADTGMMRIRFAAVGDAITSTGGASIAGSVGNTVGRNANGLACQIAFSSGVTAATISLQGSNTNNDADFADVAMLTFVSGFAAASNVQTNFEFVRFNVTAVTGDGFVVGSINA